MSAEWPEETEGRPRRALQLHVAGFEGPLDLLLHLIRKHEVDILDIPIAFITEEYLRYLDAMQWLDLDIAGEYLVMAAHLIELKSRVLLPRQDEEDGDEEAGEPEDPRGELVRRLLEYQRYRDAARQLDQRDLLGRDVFRRPVQPERYRDAESQPELLPVDLFQLLDVLRALLAERPAEPVHEVTADRLTVRETIGRIAAILDERKSCSLLDLIYISGPQPTRFEIIVTFLAMLELAKLRLVRLRQSRFTLADLLVERAVDSAAEALSGTTLDGVDDA